ncbi:helix-turn-helix domain-containing protein [Paenibacillus eucommiae]|uniref:AraC-like DNA-binding protein n=1 Tax=Paenibacillus eucommiae TaxID=1355755 RepID=A0ABS4IX14_9BACL|nr:helix-turn-helix domain-containing protein [Paenibacillus eucommiae]MBP1991406.1 AraC-like DNA-binding protein [Paenibacillus eucommiae]
MKLLDKMVGAAQKRAFLLRLIAYTLLVSLTPLLLSSLFFYYNTQTSLKSELDKANSSYLNQTANAMEMLLMQTKKSIEQFMVDSSLKDFEMFPRGHYYEHNPGSFADKELVFLERYLNLKKKVIWNLENLQYTNNFIDSVYYVERTKGIVLEPFGAHPGSSESLTFEEAWNRLPENIDVYPFFMSLRKIKEPNGRWHEVLPVLYKTSNSNNFIVVNLHVEKMNQKMITETRSEMSRAFLVLSDRGHILLHDGVESSYEAILQDMKDRTQLTANLQPAEIINKGKNLLITYKTSSMLGWTFVNAVDLNDLYRGIANLRSVIAAVSLLLLTVTGLLCIFMSRSIYTPLRKLITYIKSFDTTAEISQQNNKRINELNWIQTSWDQAIDDNKSMRDRLKESLPAYKDKFLASLIMNPIYSNDYIEERMAFLGIACRQDHLALLLLFTEDDQSTPADIMSKNITSIKIMDTLEAQIEDCGSGFVVELAEGCIAIVIHRDPNDPGEVFSFAEQIRQEIKVEFDIHCTIGIGRPCPGWKDLKVAYEEAKEAILCRNISGTGEVIYIEDVRLESRQVFAYPKSAEMILHGYVKNGQVESAKQSLEQWIEAIIMQDEGIQYRHVQGAFMQLLVNLTDIADNVQLDLNQSMKIQNNLYAVLLQLKDIEEMAAFIGEIIECTALHIHETFQLKSNLHVEEVLRMIDESCGADVTLTTAAERLNLNPSYLSRVFKESTGGTLMDYLTGVRIEKSKHLLTESSLKIKEIGERLGYTQANYFTKLFRSYTGLTPGEYRRKYGNNDLKDLKD